ncbi:MAG: UDP-N-acetylmuramoyl-tripeptide--D-alanyl-D-alanine ligase [Clostridia bacterium]|nr:UDP-N-acetylmuramoyl-tripeptide--D-alanyl-D-alanine ligase [Clostridia bacterium]
MNLTLKDIANKTGGSLVGPDMTVTELVTDSRLVRDNTLFAIIKGERTDGMNYVRTVGEKYTVAYLTDRPIPDGFGPYLLVDDVIKAVGDIAALHLDTLSASHVAVTGSVGKTTTKNFIASALSACMSVHFSEGNKNNELGMPLTALGTTKDHDAVILEMGMRGMGQITYLCNIAKPDVAVITNVGVSHIEILGTRENILRAKCEIIDALSEGGTAVINADDDMLSTVKTDKKTLRFGIENENCDLRAVNIVDNKFDLLYKEKTYPVKLATLGIHNVYNALAAIAVGTALGCDVKKLITGVESFKGDGSRQNIYDFEGVRIFDDTYNASPASMNASMDVMQGFDGRKVVVLADMLELGDYSESAHAELSEPVKKLDAAVCICIGKYMKHLKNALDGRDGVYHCENNAQALEILKSTVKTGDNVLFKGSNSMNLSDLLNKFKGEWKNGN